MRPSLEIALTISTDLCFSPSGTTLDAFSSQSTITYAVLCIAYVIVIYVYY